MVVMFAPPPRMCLNMYIMCKYINLSVLIKIALFLIKNVKELIGVSFISPLKVVMVLHNLGDNIQWQINSNQSTFYQKATPVN